MGQSQSAFVPPARFGMRSPIRGFYHLMRRQRPLVEHPSPLRAGFRILRPLDDVTLRRGPNARGRVQTVSSGPRTSLVRFLEALHRRTLGKVPGGIVGWDIRHHVCNVPVGSAITERCRIVHLLVTCFRRVSFSRAARWIHRHATAPVPTSTPTSTPTSVASRAATGAHAGTTLVTIIMRLRVLQWERFCSRRVHFVITRARSLLARVRLHGGILCRDCQVMRRRCGPLPFAAGCLWCHAPLRTYPNCARYSRTKGLAPRSAQVHSEVPVAIVRVALGVRPRSPAARVGRVTLAALPATPCARRRDALADGPATLLAIRRFDCAPSLRNTNVRLFLHTFFAILGRRSTGRPHCNWRQLREDGGRWQHEREYSSRKRCTPAAPGIPATCWGVRCPRRLRQRIISTQ